MPCYYCAPHSAWQRKDYLLVKTKLLISIVVIATFTACGKPAEQAATGRVTAIASAFIDGFYAQWPEESAESGFPGAPADRFGDHGEDRYTAWSAQVDKWLSALDAIDRDEIGGTPAAITYAFTMERLQAIVDRRVCRMALWNVSPTWTGWQSQLVATLAVQPVDTREDRENALARVADISRFVDTEISNLRRGLDAGYLAPVTNVIAVSDQVASLVDMPLEESPFFDPAARSGDAAFSAAWREQMESGVIPALERYAAFLDSEYRGREAIGVAANPDGEACYDASVRYWSSLSMDAEDIHRTGLSEMGRIQAEMLEIARNHFGTDDLKGLFEEMRSNPDYAFASEQAMLDYVNAAVARAETAMGDWFAVVPESKLIVYPAPPFEKDSGGGFYSSGSGEDKLVGYYKVGTWNPTGISIAGTESTAFHESWPGHHLESTITLSNKTLHPVQQYMWISGSSEGWALYSERLADEIGLYSSELARLGMLSNEAYRAARLVVDPGLHVLGWTREDAIQYMLENTAEGYDGIASEVDRYAAVPGQATAYLLGSLEIQRLREHARHELGDQFDIKTFHSRLLANGAVSLPMLGSEIDDWISETLTQ
jgi:uncharacterized protein (DUF885 family)